VDSPDKALEPKKPLGKGTKSRKGKGKKVSKEESEEEVNTEEEDKKDAKMSVFFL